MTIDIFLVFLLGSITKIFDVLTCKCASDRMFDISQDQNENLSVENVEKKMREHCAIALGGRFKEFKAQGENTPRAFWKFNTKFTDLNTIAWPFICANRPARYITVKLSPSDFVTYFKSWYISVTTQRVIFISNHAHAIVGRFFWHQLNLNSKQSIME